MRINFADNFSVVLLKDVMHDISGSERRNVLVQTTPDHHLYLIGVILVNFPGCRMGLV